MQKYMSAKPTLIIVEGPDCSGKTTLAKYLAREYHAAYFKMTRTKELRGSLLMYDYMRTMQATIEWNIQNGTTVILDRCWISEFCYSLAVRIEDHLYWKAYWPELHRHILSMCGLYVFCERSDVIQAHREHENSEHPYTDEQIRDIAAIYKAFRKKWEADGEENWLIYDYATMSSELDLVRKLIDDLTLDNMLMKATK